MAKNKPTPVLLIILDGWGYRKQKKGNAIASASTPHMDKLMKKYPSTYLKAAGTAVGLPPGVMGNSEVGHLTIGAGRIVDSHPVRINKSIRNKTFFKNKEFLAAIKFAQKTKGKVHLVGMLSDKSVHSNIHHLHALLKLCKKKKVQAVVHGFLDGRDTAQKSCMKYIRKTKKVMDTLGVGCFGSLIGRYYAMDRDNRWGRTKKAYDALRYCKGLPVPYNKLSKTIKEFYAKKITDEFMPSLIVNKHSINSGDSVIFFNFREDRMQQLIKSFTERKRSYKNKASSVHDPHFFANKFRDPPLFRVYCCSFTKYYHEQKIPAAFPYTPLKNTLGELYSDKGLKQLRIAETEKYAHVTYFFNALRQKPYIKERRILIPSPKVSTYDKKPKMSAEKITKAAITGITKKRHSLIVVNFANVDMVGHTGNFTAAKKAVAFTDKCVGMLTKSMLNHQGYVVITADHGNAENMLGDSKTAHDTSDVPFIVCHHLLLKKKLRKGGLSDVAPTILSLAGIPQNRAFLGKSLL